MKKRMILMLLSVGILFGSIAGFYVFKKIMMARYFASQSMLPVSVSVTKATATPWQSSLKAVGTLSAVNGVDINSEAAGIVKAVYFKSGQSVKKDQKLILLDTSVEKATLRNNIAQFILANIDFKRTQKLYMRKVVSPAELDIKRATLLSAKATMQKTLALIQQKTITAPFSGKIGISNINIGEYIPAGNKMVNLQALDFLYVNFNLSEQDLSKISLNQPLLISVPTFKQQWFKGNITAIHSKISDTTRTISIQATLPNPKKNLYPGMFASVLVLLPEKKHVITVPQTAIAYSLHGDSVFLVQFEKNAKGDIEPHAYRQYVTLGERQDNIVEIVEGIKEKDTVVTIGQLKLQNGSLVSIEKMPAEKHR